MVAGADARAQDLATSVVPYRKVACLKNIPPSAFTRVGVYGVVHLTDSASQSFAATADILMQSLGDKLHEDLGTPPNVLPRGEPKLDWLGVDAPLHLVAYHDGRIVSRDVPQGTPTIASLFAQALHSMSTLGVLDWSADSTRDSIRFDIDFVRPTLDSAGKVTPPEFRRTGILLLSIMAPWERVVAPKAGNRPPHYPDEARRRWYEGKVLLNFVVDTSGHPIISSIHDLWPDDVPPLTGDKLVQYQNFVESSESAVREMEFIPAIIGGCKVPQLVQMPFVYDLRR